MALPKLWLLLVAMRLCWTAVGQTGYIHPDEFFQSVEVVAGDVLGLEVETTWEFQPSRPLRSILLPLLTCGPPLWLVGVLRQLVSPSVTAHLLLVAPRLSVTLIGLAAEILLYRLAKRLRLDPVAVVTMYASSYVAMVYYTRTLSNTLESFLFIVLMFFTVSPCNHSDEKQCHGDEKQGRSQGQDQRRDWNVFSAAVVGVVVSAGMFNRPTFLLFAVTPCTYWIFHGCSGAWSQKEVFVAFQRVMTSGLAAACTALLFILCDTLYYTRNAKLPLYTALNTLLLATQPPAESITTYITTIARLLVVTPANFIMYNSDAENLAAHGLHPRFLHLTVNGPLLFGLLPVFLLVDLIITLHAMIRFGSTVQPCSRLVLMLCYFVPVGFLSLVPHQEPRFLVPLLTPAVLLCGRRVFRTRRRWSWTALWIGFNLVASLFYGVLHQGALTNCLTYLHTLKQNTSSTVIFYHTYMPPRFLLTNSKPNQTLDNRITILDLQGASLSSLTEAVAGLQAEHFLRLVAPASLHRTLCEVNPHLDLRVERRFGGHLSLEDPPDLQTLHPIYSWDSCETAPSHSQTATQNIQAAFSLHIYTLRRSSFSRT